MTKTSTSSTSSQWTGMVAVDDTALRNCRGADVDPFFVAIVNWPSREGRAGTRVLAALNGAGRSGGRRIFGCG